ncbi:MAG: hypothetical protein HYS18_12735 [Burkholderiales bacterium]|nr:hypothetical protein [Burkholderiales bacterium]
MAVSRKWVLKTCAWGLLGIGSVLAAAYWLAPGKQVAPTLPGFNIDPREISLAGSSSGGFMAIQAAVAYSSSFRGVATVGSGPYFCTEGNAETGKRCAGQQTSGIPTERLVNIARLWAEEGKIDPVAHIAKQKVYVFRGTLDSIVPQDVTQAVVDFYRYFVPTPNIVSNFKIPVAHGWVSPYGTNSCLNETENYINKCEQFDIAAEFLTHFYGKLVPKNEQALSGELIEFDQNEFFDDRNADAHSADELGFAYVPASCAKQNICRAVIVLHGCQQDYSKIGKVFVTQSGVNQWADTNRMVVIYPQIKGVNLKNNYGCWDTTGYDGKDFAWKSGHQVKMLKRIADRITAKYSAASVR